MLNLPLLHYHLPTVMVCIQTVLVGYYLLLEPEKKNVDSGGVVVFLNTKMIGEVKSLFSSEGCLVLKKYAKDFQSNLTRKKKKAWRRTG